MSSGERPMGDGKCKQPNTMALCQAPRPPRGHPANCCWSKSLRRGGGRVHFEGRNDGIGRGHLAA